VAGRKSSIRERDLGQNFLTQQSFLDAEVGYAELGRADTVLEVGPGTGNLTRRLAARAGQVIAVEYDRQFRAALEDLARSRGNVTLIWGDALTVALPPFGKVVANLPYRVALPVLFRLLDLGFGCGVLIVQKDMAQRICAAPGETGYSWVSVTVQRLAWTELLGTVPAAAFTPPPRVDSAIVRLRPVSAPFATGHGTSFRRLLDGLFLNREDSLGAALGRLAGPAVVSALPGRLRSRTVSALTPEEFGEVSRFLEARKVVLPEVSDTAKRTAQAAPRGAPRRPRAR
jgi:16S rRNA (adenine1518-N6/adenine1519-N6)-dimethyltransferase